MAGSGYVFQPFPKCKYHPDGRVVVVDHAGEERLLGPMWADKPFPPPDTVPVEAPDIAEAAPKRRGRPPKERP